MADVLIADDVAVGETNADDAESIVMVDSLIGYKFYQDNTTPLVRYRKTIDGAESWGAAVTVNSAVHFDRHAAWWDGVTPGLVGEGTLIHLVYSGGTGVRYRSLDTATDTLGTERVVINPAGGNQISDCQIVRLRNGNLLVTWNGVNSRGMQRSVDGGVTWTPVFNPMEANGDHIRMMPAIGVADAFLFYWDQSTDEVSVKDYLDSPQTGVETLIAATMEAGGVGSRGNWGASIRHSDGAALLAAWSLTFSATGDLRFWTYTGGGAGGLTEGANVLLNTSSFRATVHCDQNNDRIRVGYFTGFGGGQQVRYRETLDGALTWEAFVRFDQDNDTGGNLQCPLSARADASGRFLMAWFEDGAADDWITNFVNSIVTLPTPPPPVPPPAIVPAGGTYGAAPGAPPGTILYITPDGIEYPLVTPHVTGRFVMSFSGFGTAPIQYISQRGPNQDGESVRDFNLTPRVIQLLERQQFKSRGAWWDGRADILNDLRPNRQLTATDVVTGALRIVTANGDLRDLNVFIQDGPRFEARNVDEWDEWAFEEVLRFIAHDPLWFDPTRVDFDLAFVLDAALVFPITFDAAVATDDIIFGDGEIDQSFNLDYVGTWASLPTIVITGPLDNPIIDNVTTGETLALLRNIGPGRTVTIDLAFGQKTIVDDLGNNLLGSLSTDSDLGTWHIAPTPEAPQVTGQPRPTARNVIRLRGSNPTGSTSVEVRYFTRYFGI